MSKIKELKQILKNLAKEIIKAKIELKNGQRKNHGNGKQVYIFKNPDEAEMFYNSI